MDREGITLPITSFVVVSPCMCARVLGISICTSVYVYLYLASSTTCFSTFWRCIKSTIERLAFTFSRLFSKRDGESIYLFFLFFLFLLVFSFLFVSFPYSPALSRSFTPNIGIVLGFPGTPLTLAPDQLFSSLIHKEFEECTVELRPSNLVGQYLNEKEWLLGGRVWAFWEKERFVNCRKENKKKMNR